MASSSGTLRRRRGFTLVELLVVITIIGMLVALLIPAVQSARETARSRQCATNLGELAKATVAYETSRGSFPGYAQLVKRSQNQWVTVDYPSLNRRVQVISTDRDEKDQATPISWAAMLLRNLERQDIWDLLVNPKADPNLPVDEQQGVLELRAVDVFICPSDSDAFSVSDRPALSYNANTGAWDRGKQGDFLILSSTEGDTVENGVMFNHAEYDYPPRNGKGPVTRLGSIRDGANMTILYSENIHKTYEDPSGTNAPPVFTWLSGTPEGNEQQFGLVWVVSTTPSPFPGNNLDNQEAINRNESDAVDFFPERPLFARPASAHNSGVNVAFCDAHVSFVRDDIDYIVYQQLLTTNGAKCEDPQDHEPMTSKAGPAIRAFRTAPPLSEQDYQ